MPLDNLVPQKIPSMPHPVPASADHIKQAAQLLRAGNLVAFPTETVYGLGADASNPTAVGEIFKAKGRPADHPLIVHIADVDRLSDWAETVPESALKLAEHFWPGPLAMILPRHHRVPLAVTGGQQTVGVRAPNHPVALALLTEFGGGIAAPSANRYCRISPTQATHVEEELGNRVDMILDGGPCQVGVESTIIDLSTATPRLLRPGQISVEAIESILQTRIDIPNAQQTGDIRAPGMLDIHYAPTTPAFRCSSEELAGQIQMRISANQTIGVLTYRSNVTAHKLLHNIHLSDQPHHYARHLYAALRELDHQKTHILLIEQPPITEAWRAINDRLKKASQVLA